MKFNKKTNLILILAIFGCLVSLSNAFAYKEYEEFIKNVSKNSSMLFEYQKHVNGLLKKLPDYFDYCPFKHGTKSFDCPVIPSSPSEVLSVHKLRPSDIKVVGAMGDSITAGISKK
jgi:hypothetical protein